MRSTARSVILSIVSVRIAIALAVALAVALPVMVRMDFDWQKLSWLTVDGSVDRDMGTTITRYLPTYYAFCVPGLIALFLANAILVSIRAGEVFTRSNVRYLRLISWCCIAAAVIFAASATHTSLIMVFVAAAAVFIGLIIRVLTSVIDAGTRLKDENDFTI